MKLNYTNKQVIIRQIRIRLKEFNNAKKKGDLIAEIAIRNEIEVLYALYKRIKYKEKVESYRKEENQGLIRWSSSNLPEANMRQILEAYNESIITD